MKTMRLFFIFLLTVSLILFLTACGFLSSTDVDDDNTPPAPPQPTPPDICEEHVWDAGFRLREPSCSLDGICRYTCTACNEVKDESIPKIPHTFSEEEWGRNDNYHWRDAICNCFSGAVADKGEHTFDEGRVWDEPSCTQYGYYVYTCTVCEYSKFEQLPRTEHTYSEEWSYNVDYHWRDATCGCSSQRTDHASHDWDEGIVAAPPTCAEKGTLTRSCTVCDAQKEESIPKIDEHTWNEGVITEPTCTQEGYTTHVCTTCGESYTDTPTDTVPHTYVATIIPPTCTQEGCTTHTCSECGFFYTDTPVSMIPHVYDNVISFSATCTAPGVIYTYCSGCGEKYSEVVIPKTPHPYVSTVIEPTCTSTGYTRYDCPDCDDWYIGDTTEKTEHVYTVSRFEATCTSGPHNLYTCDSCGHMEYESTGSPLPHDYVATVNPPTCQRGGDTTYVCSSCSKRYVDDYTYKVDHSYTNLLCIWCNTKEYSFDLKFTLSADESYYTVSGMGKCTDTNVIIPHTHEGIPVREIAESAFKGNTKIVSVTFLKGGEAQQSVGAFAFSGCTALKEIKFGANVVNIGEQVLTECPALESITVDSENAAYQSTDNCLIDIAQKTVIAGCKTSLIPTDTSVRGIGDYAFSGSTGLTSITIPSNVIYIGIYAFKNCTGLENAYFVSTANWYFTTSKYDATNQINGSIWSVIDPSFAASRLTLDYPYYWFKKPVA